MEVPLFNLIFSITHFIRSLFYKIQNKIILDNLPSGIYNRIRQKITIK